MTVNDERNSSSFVSFRFVSFRFVSFRFVSFRFVIYRMLCIFDCVGSLLLLFLPLLVPCSEVLALVLEECLLELFRIGNGRKEMNLSL